MVKTHSFVLIERPAPATTQSETDIVATCYATAVMRIFRHFNRVSMITSSDQGWAAGGDISVVRYAELTYTIL